MANNSIKNTALAIDYIEAHLAEKIDLDIVANAVHYSKYHLHRISTKTIELTIHEYVQRRKLTEAAKLLVFSNKPILDIALIAGYESQQAFTNIFTAMYKQPPSKYRNNEKFYPLQAKFEFEGEYDMLDNEENVQRDIDYSSEEDIPCWMVLVRLVIDGFPHLHEDEYIQVLKQRIKTKQALILRKVYQALRPNGKFIFDVFTPLMRKDESRSWYYEEGRFLSEKPHICLKSVYQYDDKDNTELRQSIVITEATINCYNIWDHFFTKESLLSEIQPAGFKAFEFYGDIAGKEFSDKGDTICGVFTK